MSAGEVGGLALVLRVIRRGGGANELDSEMTTSFVGDHQKPVE